jgi:hypothetical protein
MKCLRETPEGSREWLIWSHYHALWHRRCSDTGGACGYTADIAEAGLFPRSKALGYHDGERNEPFHFSEKLALIQRAIAEHDRKLGQLQQMSVAA